MIIVFEYNEMRNDFFIVLNFVEFDQQIKSIDTDVYPHSNHFSIIASLHFL